VAESRIKHIPNHVAIIMDGNGRWAEKRGLPRLAGHRAGTDNVRRAIKCFNDHDVKYVTIYAFSTENWSRPQREVQGLMRIMEEVIDREAENLHKDGVKLIHLGNLDGISEKLKKKVQYAVELTENNSKGTLCIAFNYGGRAEIIGAVKRILRDGILPNKIDGGEMRLSNFLIWQAAYSEYYATPTLWPDFGPEEIEQALIAYSERERRFGGLVTEG